jgi:hypothetical protein
MKITITITWKTTEKATVQGLRVAALPEVDSIISSNISHAPPEQPRRLRA